MVRSESTMRTTGTSGSLGSAMRSSAPAPSEKIALRLGKLASNPGGGFQTQA
jgi:hypothetical protein